MPCLHTQFSTLWNALDTPSSPSAKNSDHFTAQLSRDLAGHCHSLLHHIWCPQAGK